MEDLFKASKGQFEMLLESLVDENFSDAKRILEEMRDAREIEEGKKEIVRRINKIVKRIDKQSATSQSAMDDDIEFYSNCYDLNEKA
jgi:DNA-binding transcriptional regulator GbsR (MarR family)